MKQVIYFEDYNYYDNMNLLVEELTKQGVKILSINISSRPTKSGSKVTHTLIVNTMIKFTIDIHQREPYPDIQGIVIKFNGGGVIEV
jgi:hypothetical protein